MFVTLEDSDLYKIVYDEQTKVEYVITKIKSGISGPNIHGYTSVSPLLKADGTPKVYNYDFYERNNH